MSDEQQSTVLPPDDSPQNRPSSTSAGSQNLLLGIGAGAGAMISGTLLWIFIAQKFQVTWMSVAIAFGVASAIKYAGKTKEMWVGIVSAVLSLIAALSGNLATIIFMAAKNYKKTPVEILTSLDFGTITMYLSKYAGFLGIIFYGATIYVGFWYAYEHPKKVSLAPPDL